MKRSVAAWLLIGLSFCVPQFCKGEESPSTPPHPTPPNPRRQHWVQDTGECYAWRWRCSPGLARGGGLRGGGSKPWVLRKSALKVRASAWG